MMHKFIGILLLSGLGTVGVTHAQVTVDESFQRLYQEQVGGRFGVDDSFNANTFNFGAERRALLETRASDLAAIGSRPVRSNFSENADFRAAVATYNADRLVVIRAHRADIKALNQVRSYISSLNTCFNRRNCRDRISNS